MKTEQQIRDRIAELEQTKHSNYVQYTVLMANIQALKWVLEE